jgi:uncharacterized membrane protein
MKKLSKLRDYYFYFVLYAFIGWLYEVILWAYRYHKFVNRGFLHGPYLPVYGFGALILLLCLHKFMHKKHKLFKLDITPILVFILIFIITSLVEYLAHYILSTYFNIILWDYSKQFLNINGRICFNASLNFAIIGTICLYLFQPLFEKLISKTNPKVKNIIFIILASIMLIDLILTLLKI